MVNCNCRQTQISQYLVATDTHLRLHMDTYEYAIPPSYMPCPPNTTEVSCENEIIEVNTIQVYHLIPF